MPLPRWANQAFTIWQNLKSAKGVPFFSWETSTRMVRILNIYYEKMLTKHFVIFFDKIYLKYVSTCEVVFLHQFYEILKLFYFQNFYKYIIFSQKELWWNFFVKHVCPLKNSYILFYRKVHLFFCASNSRASFPFKSTRNILCLRQRQDKLERLENKPQHQNINEQGCYIVCSWVSESVDEQWVS